jgi:hypothetical protein
VVRATKREVQRIIVSRSIGRLTGVLLPSNPLKTLYQKERSRGDSCTLIATTKRVVVSPPIAEF